MTSEDLYNRLLFLAKDCQKLITLLPKNTYNTVYSSQLIRSASSPGANYIEAIEASSGKDFIHRLKICKKETKESIHWLTLIQSANASITTIKSETEKLIREARELIRIFSSAIATSERNQKIKK